MTPKIVILDAELAMAQGGNISWTEFENLGDLVIYDKTTEDTVVERAADAHILVTNKFRLNDDHFKACPHLKLICLLSTGYDVVDIIAARKRGIIVSNAPAYSTDSVAQHVFAMLLHHTNRISEHNKSVQRGDWYTRQWSYEVSPLKSLKVRTMGICGYGKIGKQVGKLAKAFGMDVIVYTRTPDLSTDVTYVNMDQFCAESDVISIHLPYNEQTHELFNKHLFSKMKKDAILINTGRGALINEQDLREHLLLYPEFTAALDVLSKEPPQEGHPLIGLDNCIITPHQAWSNPEAKSNLLNIVADNVRAYLAGSPQNVVN